MLAVSTIHPNHTTVREAAYKNRENGLERNAAPSSVVFWRVLRFGSWSLDFTVFVERRASTCIICSRWAFRPLRSLLGHVWKLDRQIHVRLLRPKVGISPPRF